jgi:hypothetical protein
MAGDGVVYSCPACGEAMVCSPELAAAKARITELEARLEELGDVPEPPYCLGAGGHFD